MAEYNPRDFKDPVLDYDFNKIQKDKKSRISFGQM